MVAVLFATIVLVMVPVVAPAQITAVSIRVDGLSCPFCAYSLEKKIKAVDGAKDPVINVDQGLVTLTPVDGTPVDFDALREAVKKAGFTPREIRVDGVGRLETINGNATLVAENGQRLFVLAVNDVLGRLDAEQTAIITFSGTVAPSAKGDEPSTFRTLTLLSATPRGKGD